MKERDDVMYRVNEDYMLSVGEMLKEERIKKVWSKNRTSLKNQGESPKIRNDLK